MSIPIGSIVRYGWYHAVTMSFVQGDRSVRIKSLMREAFICHVDSRDCVPASIDDLDDKELVRLAAWRMEHGDA